MLQTQTSIQIRNYNYDTDVILRLLESFPILYVRETMLNISLKIRNDVIFN
jgi:hypothetical protein